MKDNTKDHEIDCLMSDIRRVEMAKANKPELYADALKKLKGEAKAIMSLEDLKAKRVEIEEADDGDDSDDE